MALPESVVAKVLMMRRHKQSWGLIAESLRLKTHTIRMECDPEYRERHTYNRPDRHQVDPPMPVVIEVVDKRSPRERMLSAFWGDPLPGRSAYDEIPKAQLERLTGRPDTRRTG